MAQRTVALCDSKFIGIESIYTVVDGKQINIPDKLAALRARSRKNELFCPCGCGSNLILVEGQIISSFWIMERITIVRYIRKSLTAICAMSR